MINIDYDPAVAAGILKPVDTLTIKVDMQYSANDFLPVNVFHYDDDIDFTKVESDILSALEKYHDNAVQRVYGTYTIEDKHKKSLGVQITPAQSCKDRVGILMNGFIGWAESVK